MSTLTLRIKKHINQDFISLFLISILVSILVIIENNYFSIIYPILLCLGVGLFLLILKHPKLGLYLLIFNLPLNPYIPLFGLSDDQFSISVNELLMVMLLISLIFKKLYNGKLTVPQTNLNRPILILIAFNAVSLFLAISDLSTINYLKCWLYFLLWAEYFLIYFLILDLIKTDKEIKTIFSLLIIAGGISVFSAIYQQIVGSELKSIGVVTETGETYYRLATPFGFYSNHFGAYLLIILSILFHFYFSNRKWHRFGYLLLILPTLYALFYTFSRASFLGLVTLIIILYVTQKVQRKKIMIVTLLFTIVSLVIFTPVFLRWQKKAVMVKSRRLYLEHNIRERLSQWEASWDQFLNHPVIGKGFYTYRYRQVSYSSHFGFVKYIDHPDNAYVKLLIESGILGLTIFLIFVSRIYKSAFMILKSENSDLRLIGLVTITALTCLLVTSFFETMFSVGRVIGQIFVLIGLMTVKKRIEFNRI